MNVKKEGKGDNKVLSTDLKISVVTSNDLLISFHPQLRLMLFTKEGAPRFKEMGPVPWERKFERMVLALMSGISEKPLLRFSPVMISDFEFTAIGNGKVRSTFKVHVLPDKGEFEKLAALLAEPCELAVHSVNSDLFAGNGAAAASASPRPQEPAAAPASQTETDPPEAEEQSLEAIGELTPEIRQAIKTAGSQEAAKHEDDRDFEGGMKAAILALGLKRNFVEEYLAEIQSDYTEGWQEVPADV